MKHITSLRSFALATLAAGSFAGLQAQIAISPSAAIATPNPKAMLDLSDITRGFLAPRFNNANRPLTPANSLLYYQLDSNTVTGEGRGYYYWDSSIPQWVKASVGSGWRLGGNTGTNPLTDFIGTTNNVAMRVRTNGVERINLNATGQVQVGPLPYPAATELLEVNGAMRIFTANPPATASDATPLEGAIRFNSVSGAHEGYINQVPVSVPANLNNYVGWYQLENAFKTRVKQRYESVPVAACTYPAPNVPPTGTTFGGASGWLTIDVNGATANPSSAATLETPYSTFWEDGRHQYLYRSTDMEALGVCPNTNINGIAFMTNGTGAAIGMRNVKVRMKNEGLMALTDFVNSGLVDCATIATYPAAPLVVTNGWNAHMFNVTPWQWAGVGNNMLVEFCFDNQDWTSNTGVYYENTAYNATYGLYCDACGSPIPGGSTCYYPGPCPVPVPNNGNGVWNAPTGPSSTTVGIICTGWGWNGFLGGGCAWTSATSLTTCDGTFQYIGAQTAAARRPILKINAQTTGVVPTYINGNYLLASGEGVMIGDYPAWANSSLYSTCATYRFKGPGTISARSSVWGGAVLLSDHVFDNYYDGRIKQEDQQQAIGYRYYPVKEMANYIKQEHHLPTIAGRDDWKKQSGFSVDQLTNQLWVTVETQSLYIKELNDRMTALQDYLIEKRLKDLKK